MSAPDRIVQLGGQVSHLGVRQAGEDGFAIVDQEYDMRVRSIGVPVTRGGQVAASLSISVLAEHLSAAELKSRLLPALQRAAAEFA